MLAEHEEHVLMKEREGKHYNQFEQNGSHIFQMNIQSII